VVRDPDAAVGRGSDSDYAVGDMIDSRNISDLDPVAQEVCRRHIELCKDRGIELLVTSTWRDFEAQENLYAIGRTKELNRSPVTKARGGKSWHNYRCAWDVVGLVGGKPVWNKKDPIWQEIIQAGKAAGAEAGAEWKSFPDFPHFQIKPIEMTLTQARQQFDQTGSIFTA
jgi:peptidoglycan L-alanyl-D-glutamate endopeptidase CwlK